MEAGERLVNRLKKAPERPLAPLVSVEEVKEQSMGRPEEDKHDVRQRDLEDERPGFTPAGRAREDAESEPSTRDLDQPSALGGKVSTRSKVKQKD